MVSSPMSIYIPLKYKLAVIELLNHSIACEASPYPQQFLTRQIFCGLHGFIKTLEGVYIDMELKVQCHGLK